MERHLLDAIAADRPAQRQQAATLAERAAPDGAIDSSVPKREARVLRVIT
jgi:hypothetical protein